MEFIHSYFILVISFLIFTFAFSKLKIKSKTTLNLPPGPWKLPFVGDLLLLARSHDPPHRTFRTLAMKYGPLMHLKLGEVNTVIVSSPQMAKEVMKSHDIAFASRPSLVALEVICYGNTDIAFAPYGDYWRQLRKICTLELLSAKRVQSFQPIREDEFSSLCRWIASNAGSTINLTERVNMTTYDIITRATLGEKTKEGGTFTILIKEVIKLGAGFEIADMYPSIRSMRHISGLVFKLKRLHTKVDTLLQDIINERVAAKTEKMDETKTCEDLIDVLLKFHDDGLELPLTIDNIKAVLVNIFGGGSETSSTIIDWAMSEMLNNPNVLETAQQEVREVFKDEGHVVESQLDKLKYLKLVINETLRMHPPVPLLLPRENSEDCEINGYYIPAKTRVLVNAWAIGRDPHYWKDAESFIPERFSHNVVDYKGNNFEYIPFGAGRRICPGMSFGLINVELPLAMLLYHFDWFLPDGIKAEEVDMTEVFGVTVARKHHLHVVPIVKKPIAF